MSDEKIKTIRDPYDFALEIEARICSREWTVTMLAKKLESYVKETLDSLAVEPSEDAWEFAYKYVNENSHPSIEYSYQILDDADGDELFTLITDRDERIRRECADRAVAWYNSSFDEYEEHVTDDEWWDKGLRSAIMGEAKE